jgi:hypothetical protein
MAADDCTLSVAILTERKDHLLHLADRLSRFAKNVIVFHGGMKAKAQKESERASKEVQTGNSREGTRYWPVMAPCLVRH